ncbi:MAG: VTT domain-containing protein [Planctomycetales bacterium]|nr:VTT domain-containing protein [Planctomycetales bacterium]
MNSARFGTILVRISLPLALISVGMVLLASGYRFGDLSGWLQSTGKWAPLLFIAAGVLAMSMMTPKTMVSLAAGAMFGTQVGCPTMLVTAVAAAVVNYQIGRHWIGSGRAFSESLDRPSESHQPEPQPTTLPAALATMARDAGFGFHLLVRLSPIPTTLISYSMGAVQARLTPYTAAAAVAVLPQLLYVHAASLAMDMDQSQRYRWISSVLSLAVAVIVSITLPNLAMQRLKQLRGRR